MIKNCIIKTRQGDTKLSICADHCDMDGYAIIPREEYEALLEVKAEHTGKFFDIFKAQDTIGRV